ncbi:MAG: tetratricopeptide repeat protein, partial [Myxococcota bacterium]
VAFSNEQIRPQARPQLAILLSGVLLVILTLWALRAGRDIGWNLDRDAVQESLRTRVETDHFIIHVDPSVSPERLRRIVEDHEHRYRQLTTFFKTEPDGKIVSFIYRNRAQKARLMGAQRTQIARPWNREVHIDGFRVPHPVLKHELAHVFAGKLATGPFKVPAVAGIFVNIGVVEGIAVAADWRVRELTVHGWTKAMQGLGLMPDLRKSLDVFGFWSISSSRAYTVAGSFFRYLVDKYGIEKFGVLYATNDFTAAYEQSLDALVTEWEAFLKGIPLPQDDLLVAEHRFKRPSIFQKVCPHVAANISSRGYARLHSGDLEGAQADLEQIYGYAPANPTPLIALAEGFARAERFEEAQAFVERALEAPGATLKGKTQAIEARANLAWREDRTEDAVKDYAVVKERHLSTPSDRLQQARIMALTRTSTAVTDLMRDVLLSDQKPQRGLARLAEASVTIRNVPLVHYLYARALERAGAYPEAVEAAARAVELDIGGDPLKTEAILTYGRLLWWDGKAHEAAVVFDAIAQNHASPAMTAAAADWADRARFTAAKTSTRSPSLIE